MGTNIFIPRAFQPRSRRQQKLIALCQIHLPQYLHRHRTHETVGVPDAEGRTSLPHGRETDEQRHAYELEGLPCEIDHVRQQHFGNDPHFQDSFLYHFGRAQFPNHGPN